MDTSHDEAMRMEALSDKVLQQLPQAVWRELFLGAGRETIHFEERNLSLVYVDAEVSEGERGGADEAFYRELQRLNQRHDGRLDPYINATALVTFEDPGAAVRMALQLQQAARGLALRIGVVSGPCMLAYFRSQGRLWCTPLGEQPRRAAHVAASASAGGIVISPETYEPSLANAQRRAASLPLPDFHDSEMDLSSLSQALGTTAVDIDLGGWDAPWESAAPTPIQ